MHRSAAGPKCKQRFRNIKTHSFLGLPTLRTYLPAWGRKLSSMNVLFRNMPPAGLPATFPENDHDDHTDNNRYGRSAAAEGSLLRLLKMIMMIIMRIIVMGGRRPRRRGLTTTTNDNDDNDLMMIMTMIVMIQVGSDYHY